MSSIVGWFLAVILLGGNVVAVRAALQARGVDDKEGLEAAALRCRHGLLAVSVGFIITLFHAIWAVFQAMSAATDDLETELLSAAFSAAFNHTAMLLLAVLIPSACIIYLNLRIRRARICGDG